MSHSLEPETVSSFYHYGKNTLISANGQFEHPELILIGDRVSIKEHYYIQSIEKDGLHEPQIVIGDDCKFEPGLTLHSINRIVIERNVHLGCNVSISDTRHEYRQVGIPVSAQGWVEPAREVFIGEGTEIGDGTVIAGNIRIGKHSIIHPGSVVEQDIPENCVAGGSPAQILQINPKKEPHSPESPPLLSICIPTYNRAANLEHCLASIFSQLQHDSPVEVIISDNASTDDTPQVIARYAARYPCLKSFRNSSNIGAERNIFLITQLAQGRFIKLHGDDDYFVPNTIPPLLDVIKNHLHCGFIYLNVHNHDGQVFTAEGASAFLRISSIMSTFISGIIIKKEEYEHVKEPLLYIGSLFNHTYLLYEILTRNPHFCVVNWRIFNFSGNPPSGYNFGEVVIRNYQTILRHFIGKGLSEEDFRQEKKASLFNKILPWYGAIMRDHAPVVTADFEEIFTEFYAEESYFEEVLPHIKAIKAMHKAKS